MPNAHVTMLLSTVRVYSGRYVAETLVVSDCTFIALKSIRICLQRAQYGCSKCLH